MEFENTFRNNDGKIMEFCEPPVARKTAVGHLCARQLVFWLLKVSSFNYFQNACMFYKHAVVAAFRIYAQH